VHNSAGVGSREEVLGLLNGVRPSRKPCFSGLISVTEPGLASAGLNFGEVHTDSTKMTTAALTSNRLFGFESAVVPLDLCVEASALGARVDFRADAPRPEFPMIVEPLASRAADFNSKLEGDVTRYERVALVLDALRILKEQVGAPNDVPFVVGAWITGPVTLAMQVLDIRNLTADMAREPDAVGRVLDTLTDLLVQVASAYRAAGADFITIHEMGGSPGFVGPPVFKTLILPRLKRLLAALSPPRVLSVCGNTNRAMQLLAECGADALSVDQANDLAHSREVLGADALLFGNIDPIGTLSNGDEASVRAAVRGALDAGVDAIWPGCDLWPPVPAANMHALVDETRKYSRMAV